MSAELPRWATEMRDLFRSGSAAQFILHGNVFDIVPSGGKLLSVPAFLEQVMFATYDVVLRYDRSRGVRATRDRKSTRLNSSHLVISYAVFCLKHNNNSIFKTRLVLVDVL